MEQSTPAMIHYPQVKDMELPPIVDNQGANVFMKTISHSKVPGKQMQAGIFRMDPGPSFTNTYCYECILFVLNGKFKVSHVNKHETHLLTPGDNMYIQAGTQLQFATNTANSRFYFVMQPPQAEDCGRIGAGLKANPRPTVQKDLPSVNDLPLLPNDAKANAYLKDILMSKVPGKEMTSGLYKILKGPAHDYVYDYEEFKYIVDGQLNLKDGTGQYVEAKAGDLMYFPNGTSVNFGTVEHGLGFFVGQRVGGSTPAMVHFSQVKDMELPPVVDNQGANVFMKTIVHSKVPGKQMQAGLFQMDPGPSFTNTYCYECILFVLHGKFSVDHVSKNETHQLDAGDNMYIQAGTQLKFTTTTANSRFYFVMQPPQAEDCGRIHAGLNSNPSPTVQKDLPSVDDLPPLPNDFKANAYLKDILMSKVPGKEMTSGLYRILKGPAHDYVYDYEEFKYIVDGQLNLKDGTGQYVEAKAGDLMYFPDGTFINFGTVEHGLGFFVGQRVGGSA